MSAVTANPSDTAVDGLPDVSATDWFVGVPVQLFVVYRWKMTVPVGFGTAAGVAATRATCTWSWTTVPATAVVITWFCAFRMSVRTVSSAHSFVASALSPTFASPVERASATPSTVTVVAARATVVPGVADTITTEQEPVPPVVWQELGPTNVAG